MRQMAIWIGFVVVSLCFASTGVCDGQPTGAATQPATKPAEASTADKPSADNGPADKKHGGDQLSVTEHEIAVADNPLKYRATTGRLTLSDDADKPKADFFFVAYEKLPVADEPSSRPITFLFNGGPGSASVWLHLGTVGPQRLALDKNGDPPSPPYHLENNPQTWLSATDLVFIDPVGTGYSRPAAGEKAEQFYGVQEDIHWVGEFIRAYTTKYQRWLSPKFLAGESYGTTRAAGLSSYLIEKDGISISGIILISSVLNFQTLEAQSGNDLPYVLWLPTYTAVAWYHKKLSPELQKDFPAAIEASRKWALGPYAEALGKGAALSRQQREQIARQLSSYTGLPQDVVEQSNLRIRGDRFEATLLRDQQQLIGRFDGRITGFNPDGAGATPDYDPSLYPYLAAYSATFNDYVRRTLKYESDLPYDVLSGKVQPWNYETGGSGYVDLTPSLQTGLLENPSMQVLFASGYFDLATPFATATYTIDHLKLSEELRSHVSQKFYDGGHMIYHYRPALEMLNADVKAFIAKNSGRSAAN